MEIWREVEGYEGLYAVSNYGNVKNIKRNHILHLRPQSNGYFSVLLYKNGASKNYMIHRLVAQAFCLKEQGKDFVNHKDENKKNNMAENLEWCTREYNSNYGTVGERIKAKRGHNSRQKRCVGQYSINGELIQTCESIAIAAKITGTARTSIWECCNYKHKTANGYIWKYING